MEKAFAYISVQEDISPRILKKYCKTVHDLGYVPISPQHIATQFLSLEESDGAKEYHEIAKTLLKRCRMVVVCGAEITSTMSAEIGMAEKYNLICTTLQGLIKTKMTDQSYPS